MFDKVKPLCWSCKYGICTLEKRQSIFMFEEEDEDDEPWREKKEPKDEEDEQYTGYCSHTRLNESSVPVGHVLSCNVYEGGEL